MTFSRRCARGALLLGLAYGAVQAPAWAALGERHTSMADAGSSGMASKRSVAAMVRYTLHETQRPDGSRVREYVAPNGQVFAVSWNTLYKPDLSTLLGQSFPVYASAAQVAAQRGGIQRQFHHDDADLVVQSTGHLHVFAGHAYLRSQLPQGVTAQTLGWE